MTGTLYVVGTPIGNLEDVSDRARRTLASVDVVAAEDTRRTGLLLRRLGVRARLVSFFEGNEAQRVPELVWSLHSGLTVALVSDAGMPAISDPGYRLVAACVEAGVAVDVVPGPSAVIAALVVSGLPTDRFVYEGFLPRAGKARTACLAALAREPRTIVLFEAARRVASTLRDLRSALGDRRVVVARELTKLHQEILRGTLDDVASAIDERGGVKGEIVLVVEGAPDVAADPDDAVDVARRLVASGSRKRDAARQAAEATGGHARDIYERLVTDAARQGRTAPRRMGD